MNKLFISLILILCLELSGVSILVYDSTISKIDPIDACLMESDYIYKINSTHAIGKNWILESDKEICIIIISNHDNICQSYYGE